MGAFIEKPHLETDVQVRLVLDKIEAPVIANVSERSNEGMRVKQALPFLQLHSGVRDESGRRAVIRNIDLSVEDGTPSLVLDLVYESPNDEYGFTLGTEDTLPAIYIAPGAPIRRDSTLPLGLTGRRPRSGQTAKDSDTKECAAVLGPDQCCLPSEHDGIPPVHIASERESSARDDAPLLLTNGCRDQTESIDIDFDELDIPEKKPMDAMSKETLATRAKALATALFEVVR